MTSPENREQIQTSDITSLESPELTPLPSRLEQAREALREKVETTRYNLGRRLRIRDRG